MNQHRIINGAIAALTMVSGLAIHEKGEFKNVVVGQPIVDIDGGFGLETKTIGPSPATTVSRLGRSATGRQHRVLRQVDDAPQPVDTSVPPTMTLQGPTTNQPFIDVANQTSETSMIGLDSPDARIKINIHTTPASIPTPDLPVRESIKPNELLDQDSAVPSATTGQPLDIDLQKRLKNIADQINTPKNTETGIAPFPSRLDPNLRQLYEEHIPPHIKNVLGMPAKADDAWWERVVHGGKSILAGVLEEVAGETIIQDPYEHGVQPPGEPKEPLTAETPEDERVTISAPTTPFKTPEAAQAEFMATVVKAVSEAQTEPTQSNPLPDNAQAAPYGTLETMTQEVVDIVPATSGDIQRSETVPAVPTAPTESVLEPQGQEKVGNISWPKIEIQPDGSIDTTELETLMNRHFAKPAKSKVFENPDGYVRFPDAIPGINYKWTANGCPNERFMSVRSAVGVYMLIQEWEAMKEKYPELEDIITTLIAALSNNHIEHEHGDDVDWLRPENVRDEIIIEYLKKIIVIKYKGEKLYNHLIHADDDVVDALSDYLNGQRPKIIDKDDHPKHVHFSADGGKNSKNGLAPVTGRLCSGAHIPLAQEESLYITVPARHADQPTQSAGTIPTPHTSDEASPQIADPLEVNAPSTPATGETITIVDAMTHAEAWGRIEIASVTNPVEQEKNQDNLSAQLPAPQSIDQPQTTAGSAEVISPTIDLLPQFTIPSAGEAIAAKKAGEPIVYSMNETQIMYLLMEEYTNKNQDVDWDDAAVRNMILDLTAIAMKEAGGPLPKDIAQILDAQLSGVHVNQPDEVNQKLQSYNHSINVYAIGDLTDNGGRAVSPGPWQIRQANGQYEDIDAVQRLLNPYTNARRAIEMYQDSEKRHNNGRRHWNAHWRDGEAIEVPKIERNRQLLESTDVYEDAVLAYQAARGTPMQ